MPLPRQPSDVTDSEFSDDVISLALPLNSTHLFLLPAPVAFCQVGNLQLRKTTRPPETGPFCLRRCLDGAEVCTPPVGRSFLENRRSVPDVH